MNQKLEAIRQKCIEANQDKWTRSMQAREFPIRLADVLLAMHGNRKSGQLFAVVGNGAIYELSGGNFKEDADKPALASWNLRQDDLEEQSPETIDFIANVLGV